MHRPIPRWLLVLFALSLPALVAWAVWRWLASG